MKHLHCASLPSIRVLKKYVTHVNHAGFKIPVDKWNNEVKIAKAMKAGSLIPIPYNGKIGTLVRVELDFDKISLPKGRRPRSMVTGYTLVVSDGQDVWNVFRVPSNDFSPPKLCAECGKGYCRRSARAGRYEDHKGFKVKIPADIALLECDVCHEILMSPRDMENLAPIVEAADNR